MMDIKKIYSCCKILSVIEVGDSLTQLQKKTELSYVTIQHCVSFLETSGCLRTQEMVIKNGKSRICTDFTSSFKEAALRLINETKFFDSMIERNIP